MLLQNVVYVPSFVLSILHIQLLQPFGHGKILVGNDSGVVVSPKQ